MKVKLSKRAIDEATYQGPGGCYLWDTETAGFGLRLYPTGRKTFLITYRARGKQRFYTLGPFGILTLPQARAKAIKFLAQILDGDDPSERRRADRKAPTLSDLADRHIEEHVKIKNKARSAKRARQLWDRCVLPKLGKRKVADLQRAEIARLMTSMSSTPAMANKILTLLSKAFNLAEVWGWRPEGSNPCRHVERYKEESRERYLSESELKRLGEVLARIEYERTASPQAIAAIRLLILTGCRSSEILKLRWDEVDFERQCLNLSDSKTGKRTVMLNSAALEILEGLERVEGNPLRDPGRQAWKTSEHAPAALGSGPRRGRYRRCPGARSEAPLRERRHQQRPQSLGDRQAAGAFEDRHDATIRPLG